MTLDIQYKINSDQRLKHFLRENSHWYKELNRNPDSFKSFVADMKDKYELKTTDKLNRMLNNISMLQTFLDVLK